MIRYVCVHEKHRWDGVRHGLGAAASLGDTRFDRTGLGPASRWRGCTREETKEPVAAARRLAGGSSAAVPRLGYRNGICWAILAGHSRLAGDEPVGESEFRGWRCLRRGRGRDRAGSQLAGRSRRMVSGSSRMNKGDIVGRVAGRMHLSRDTAEGAVDTVLEAIAEALVKEEAVRIARFGAFATRNRAARRGRNPRTGESVSIPAWKTPSFKPGKALRDAVNGRPGTKTARRTGDANGRRPSAGTKGATPAWALLDPGSAQALGAEPSAENGALRLAGDLTREEAAQSAFVRNALVLLAANQESGWLWLTPDDYLSPETVVSMRKAMSWPDMEAVEDERDGRRLREKDIGELGLLRRAVETALPGGAERTVARIGAAGARRAARRRARRASSAALRRGLLALRRFAVRT